MKQKAEFCNICGVKTRVYLYKSVIIGGGCAALNCADSLYDMSCDGIAVVTTGLDLSTSVNTGSDKQTYYKLSTSGDQPDSVYDMAKTLFSGGCMQGYHALCEASMSLRCFYKLISLGVDFPQNEYGEYVGYRTDHDYRKRATSCGPLTSKFMAQALIKSVRSKNIDIHENMRAVKLIVNDGKVRGVICVGTDSGEISVFISPNVVLATGGPSGIYDASVYPKCHNGALSLALEAGCHAINLTEWQYGIASTDFRWNLSGSYMQVIPRFVSVDGDGTEREFLSEYIGEERFSLIFQKGYNWPFCPNKESTAIDLAVYSEIKKGRRVFLDFTRNDSAYDASLLSAEARAYLSDCGVLELGTPVERLKKMNMRAFCLYLDSAGIDLEKQALAIDVCAQHCNGGVDCDENYMTCVDGLYACGECAGVFGVSRPGGTALNSTQVSSLRAAQHIVKCDRGTISLSEEDKTQIQEFISLCDKLLSGNNTLSDILRSRKNISSLMSLNAAHVREESALRECMERVMLSLYEFADRNRICEKSQLSEILINRDILISAQSVLCAMIKYAEMGFKSRGSFIVVKEANCDLFNVNSETESDKETLIKIKYADGRASAYTDKVKPIPCSEQWFETVYNSYYGEKHQ